MTLTQAERDMRALLRHADDEALRLTQQYGDKAASAVEQRIKTAQIDELALWYFVGERVS